MNYIEFIIIITYGAEKINGNPDFFWKNVSDSTGYDTIRHSASFALQKNTKKTELSIFQISGDPVQNRVFFHCYVTIDS